MRMQDNTILITGGATGIGFALAERLAKLGNTVIICGRRQDRLDSAKSKVPSLNTIRCDISRKEDRESLFRKIESDFKGLNVLINNAGIQKPIDFSKGGNDISAADAEIDTNLKAQIHLSSIFISLLSKRESAIMNVSSGLGFVPLARFPVYSATKAAIHSFTMSLRHQLKGTTIRVFELIPPTVHDTELKGKPTEKAEWSVSASDVAEAAIKGFENDEYEIAVGSAKRWVSSTKTELEEAFGMINQ